MNNIEIYKATDGSTEISVKIEEETVWLTQQQMVDLFKSSKANVSEHIKHIYEEGELAEASTVRKFRIVQKRYSKPKTWKCSARLSSVF